MFKTKINELELYIMKNFINGTNNVKYKTNKYKLKLTLTNRTRVEETNNLHFGMIIFNLRPYDQLINQLDVDENDLFGNYQSYLFM